MWCFRARRIPSEALVQIRPRTTAGLLRRSSLFTGAVSRLFLVVVSARVPIPARQRYLRAQKLVPARKFWNIANARSGAVSGTSWRPPRTVTKVKAPPPSALTFRTISEDDEEPHGGAGGGGGGGARTSPPLVKSASAPAAVSFAAEPAVLKQPDEKKWAMLLILETVTMMV